HVATECCPMMTRPRSRSLLSRLRLVARDVTRRSRYRIVAGLVAVALLAGSGSLGFALSQEAPGEPVGLQGVWPDFPPPSVSFEAFSRLGGNWAAWSEATAADVGEFYSLADKDLAGQREILAKIRSRIRVLERALKDPAYSMIRDELTSIYGPLKLRADLFQRSLDLLEADAKAAAGPARSAADNDLRNALSS